ALCTFHYQLNTFYARMVTRLFNKADGFNPDRMLDGNFEALPAYLGMNKSTYPPTNPSQTLASIREWCSCLHRRPFAWQEAPIAVATIFQKFDFTLVDPPYTLQLKQALTLKPKDFEFYAIPRKGTPSFSVAAAPTRSTTGAGPGKGVVGASRGSRSPLHVFYGNNTGSCEGFAQNIASEAASKDFRPAIGALNNIAGNTPTDGPAMIITASFEGIQSFFRPT
ncbi:hypothetical protein FRC06_006408, partial [Ceratobasidium sp. 370]